MIPAALTLAGTHRHDRGNRERGYHRRRLRPSNLGPGRPLTLDELLAYAPPALRERVLGAQWDWRDHFAQRETDTSIRGTIDGEPAQVVLDRLLAQEQPEQ